jgi:hypothetical protein
VLRAPSRRAFPTAAATEPPAAITPTAANWEPPVNTRSDMTHVCATDSPAPTESTPNETPYTPVAMPMPRASAE